MKMADCRSARSAPAADTVRTKRRGLRMSAGTFYVLRTRTERRENLLAKAIFLANLGLDYLYVISKARAYHAIHPEPSYTLICTQYPSLIEGEHHGTWKNHYSESKSWSTIVYVDTLGDMAMSQRWRNSEPWFGGIGTCLIALV